MITDEQAKAAQEVAKTTGKAIDAAEKAGGFIAKYIGGPLEQAVGMWEDKLKYTRWERQLRLMQRAEGVIRELGINQPTRAVPMKIAIPLLQGASLEDDDDLQDRWVNLLVNAATVESGIGVIPIYSEILSHLTPLEALILDKIYALPYDQMRYEGVYTSELPDSARICDDGGKGDHTKEPMHAVKLALASLHRSGCLSITMSMGGGEMFYRVNPTELGRSFVRACQRPSKSPCVQ